VSKRTVGGGYHWSVQTGNYHKTFLSEHKSPRKALAVVVEAFACDPPDAPGPLTCVRMFRPGQNWAVRIYVDTKRALKMAGYEVLTR
jgi:hypothetical protein